MKIKKIIAVAALSTGAIMNAPAHAILVGDASLMGPIVEDFSGYDVLITPGPQALGGGMTLTSTIDSTLGANVAELGDNGTWGVNKFAGIGDLSGFGTSETDGSITLTLASPSFGAGAKLNHYRDSSGAFLVTLEALGAGGSVLETHAFNVLGTASAFNEGPFIGIGRLTQDVTALRISGDGFVFDDVRIATAPIPEPSTYALMAAGLAFLGYASKRRASRK